MVDLILVTRTARSCYDRSLRCWKAASRTKLSAARTWSRGRSQTWPTKDRLSSGEIETLIELFRTGTPPTPFLPNSQSLKEHQISTSHAVWRCVTTPRQQNVVGSVSPSAQSSPRICFVARRRGLRLALPYTFQPSATYGCEASSLDTQTSRTFNRSPNRSIRHRTRSQPRKPSNMMGVHSRGTSNRANCSMVGCGPKAIECRQRFIGVQKPLVKGVL